MADMQISVVVDSASVLAMLEKAPVMVSTRLRNLVEAGAVAVQREMRQAAPVGVTGQLRGSVRYTFTPFALSAEVSPNVPYAAPVETGSKAHFPPYGEGTPLAAWAKLKGLNPFLVARSISRKGTKANPFVQHTYDKMKPIIEAEFNSGIGLLAKELDGGL